MGAVKIDTHAKERTLDSRYLPVNGPALDSSEGVRLLLGDYHSLVGRQYCGDYDAVVILADLATAIERAGLTDRQRQALRLGYVEDLTLECAGKLMGGIAKQNVDDYVGTAIEKIAEVYFYWAGHGEGYSLTGGETK